MTIPWRGQTRCWEVWSSDEGLEGAFERPEQAETYVQELRQLGVRAVVVEAQRGPDTHMIPQDPDYKANRVGTYPYLNAYLTSGRGKLVVSHAESSVVLELSVGSGRPPKRWGTYSHDIERAMARLEYLVERYPDGHYDDEEEWGG